MTRKNDDERQIGFDFAADPFAVAHVPHVRSSDTSKESAERLLPNVARLDRQVFRTIANAGERGVTCEEIERITGLRHQSASGACRRLVVKRFVKDSGARRLNVTGRRAAVLVLAVPLATAEALMRPWNPP